MRLPKYLLLALMALFMSDNPVECKTPNPYKILGVSQTATDQQIKKAFNKRSIKWHPDRNSDPTAKDKYEKVVNAYELLKDPERRRIYDMTGDDNPQMNAGGGGGFGGGGFGFPGGGFGFPGGGFGGFGINIQDLLRQQMGGGGGGGQRRGGQRQTFTFSFGGGEGMRFEF